MTWKFYIAITLKAKFWKPINQKVASPTNLNRRAPPRLVSLQVTPLKASRAGKANTLLAPFSALVDMKALPRLVCAWFCRGHMIGGEQPFRSPGQGDQGSLLATTVLLAAAPGALLFPMWQGPKNELDNRNLWGRTKKARHCNSTCEKRHMFWFYYTVVKRVGFRIWWGKAVLSTSLLPGRDDLRGGKELTKITVFIFF